MISLLEVAERSQKGPRIEEKEWNLSLFRKMTQLTRDYDICCPPDAPFFNTDDSVLQRAFQAAVDFLVDMGVYCISTNRVIKFTEEEILTAVREAPTEVSIGEGKDARVLKQREIEGKEPVNICPAHHAPFSEDIAPLVTKNYAQIPRADYIEGFNFTSVDGKEIFGMPLEAYAAKRQVTLLRRGVEAAGREGLAVVIYPISMRAGVLLAPIDPEHGLRRTDGILLTVLPDVKVEHDAISAAIVFEDYGSFRLGSNHAMIGGFCGGLEGTIIEGIIKPIVARIVYRDAMSYIGITYHPPPKGAGIPPQKLSWGRSVTNQTVVSRTNIICGQSTGTSSGPGSENRLWEIAMRCLTGVINGTNLGASRQGQARINAAQTPLEGEWIVEVADAIIRTGLNREKGGELMAKIIQKLRGKTAPPPKPVTELYDLEIHQPKPEYVRIYNKVKEELSSLGLSCS